MCCEYFFFSMCCLFEFSPWCYGFFLSRNSMGLALKRFRAIDRQDSYRDLSRGDEIVAAPPPFPSSSRDPSPLFRSMCSALVRSLPRRTKRPRSYHHNPPSPSPSSSFSLISSSFLPRPPSPALRARKKSVRQRLRATPAGLRNSRWS